MLQVLQELILRTTSKVDFVMKIQPIVLDDFTLSTALEHCFILLPQRWAMEGHSTMDSILPLHPVAPGLIPGVPKVFF